MAEPLTPLDVVLDRIRVAKAAEAIGAQDPNIRWELELIADKIRALEPPTRSPPRATRGR